MALTDRQRAAVFGRDKGICAFSGMSLWILDHGTPTWHHDWVDHVRPVSRGGDGSLENLVCASFFHNSKKRNNSADRSYLFKDGKPTELFFWIQGEVSPEQAEMIRRHDRLVESDWYFNRALSRILIALENEWRGIVAVRGSQYWLGASAKMLRRWRQLADDARPESFIERGLVKHPDAPDIQLMLETSRADEVELLGIYRQLARHFKANADCLHEFSNAMTPDARLVALCKAERSKSTTKPLRTMLRRNIERLDSVLTPAS